MLGSALMVPVSLVKKRRRKEVKQEIENGKSCTRKQCGLTLKNAFKFQTFSVAAFC